MFENPRRGAVLRISSDRDNRRILGGLKFSISGFFWAFKTNVSIFRVISFYAFWKFLLWLGNSAWDFLGDKFWSRDFLGF